MGVSGGKQARRLRGCVGRLQPLLSQLLHEFVGEAKQPMSFVPARVGGAKNWEMKCLRYLLFFVLFFFCLENVLMMINDRNFNFIKIVQQQQRVETVQGILYLKNSINMNRRRFCDIGNDISPSHEKKKNEK